MSAEPAPVWCAQQHGQEFVWRPQGCPPFAGTYVDPNNSSFQIPGFVELVGTMGALARAASGIVGHGGLSA